jgi:hypothetical protein
MPPVLHQRLWNEATLHGAQEVRKRMPAEYSLELEVAISQGVRLAVAHCAPELDTLARSLHRFDCGKARR